MNITCKSTHSCWLIRAHNPLTVRRGGYWQNVNEHINIIGEICCVSHDYSCTSVAPCQATRILTGINAFLILLV